MSSSWGGGSGDLDTVVDVLKKSAKTRKAIAVTRGLLGRTLWA
jgi:hypothetical protein